MRLFHELDLCIWSAIVVFCCVNACNGQSVTLVVNASAKIVETDEHFICATLDYLLLNHAISPPSVPGTSLSLLRLLLADVRFTAFHNSLDKFFCIFDFVHNVNSW